MYTQHKKTSRNNCFLSGFRAGDILASLNTFVYIVKLQYNELRLGKHFRYNELR